MTTRGTNGVVRSHSSPLRFRVATAWDILSDAIRNNQINGDDNQAAAIAFYAILSAIPFFILTLWIASLVFGSSPDLQTRIIKAIQEFSPFFSQDLLRQLGRIEQKKKILGSVGIITLLWSSALIFNAIETSFSIIFRHRQGRNYFVSKAMAISMIPMGWAVGMISVGTTYIAGMVAKYPLLAEGGCLSPALSHGFFFSHVMPFVVMAIFFALVYKVVPTGKISWGNALTGGILFSFLMELSKHLLAWYVSNYTNYDVIYGSLQAIVILVIWVFYVALILLFCAEIISSFRRRSLILIEKAFVQPAGKANVNERLFLKFGRLYKRGEYVFREGDRGTEIFYILLGGVVAEKKAGQMSKILTELGPGQYFGEMAALINQPRTASIRVSRDSEIAVIDAATFHDLLRESSNVSLTILQEFSYRVKGANEKIESLTKEWIRVTAVLYFIREWPLKGNRDPVRDLAESTGQDPDNIQEVLQDLARKKIICMDGGRVTGFNEGNTLVG